jgi:hypothetical protein
MSLLSRVVQVCQPAISGYNQDTFKYTLTCRKLPDIFITNIKISQDVDEAWAEVQTWAPALRSFVANGGRYLGFCLGGYLAGHDPGYGLLAPNDNAMQEIEEPGSQIQDEDDTIIQVDWVFSTGTKKGEEAKGRWMYFQDGVALTLGKESPAVVLGRYSSTGDVAALLSPFGRGWVGCVGPHPEADQSWCMLLIAIC